jgi:hypothetical protein
MNREKHTASSEATSTVSNPISRRAEGLLKQLSGVSDVRVELAGSRVAAVYVVPVSETATRGIVRNVQSALKAALNIAIEPRMVMIVPKLPAVSALLEAPAPKTPAPKPSAAPAPVPASMISLLGGTRLVPRVEVLELQRLNHDQLQCRVVVEVAGRRRTGSAQAGEEREGAVTLAARATLDAMRHIEMGDWSFEGAADVIIAGQRHIVVSVKKNENAHALSGAAPVHESVEHAVAVAVLNAAGLSGAAPQTESYRRVALEG